jgi:DNA-binding transcriptional LysR family regulator
VVEARSFSAAARKLGVAKSKVSRTLRSLESACGGALLYRSTREVSLTDLGQRLYANALPGIQSLCDGLKTVRQDSATMAGMIKITDVEDIGNIILTPLIVRFAQSHPGAYFEMTYTLEKLDLVEHWIDIAVRVGTTSQQSYRTRKVGGLDFILVATSRYLEKFSEINRPETLAGAAFIAFLQNGQISRQILLSRGRETVALTLKARFKTNILAAILELAQQGLGIACLPRFICKEALRSGELQEVLRGWRTPIRLLNIVTRGKQKSSLVVEAFQKYSVTELSAMFPV